MRCVDCYWSAANEFGSLDRVCCNKDSEHYNKIITKEDAERDGCDSGESKQDVSCRRMNVWE